MSGAHVLITGGAGFVGANLAARLLREGVRVRVFDSLARAGSEDNVAWLAELPGELEFVRADVRDAAAVRLAVEDVDHIVHLAAQVAVTTSLVDPVFDFDVNARGSLNVLEAARASAKRPSLAFSSTNKVYGGLEDVVVHARGERYEPGDARLRRYGVSESRPLDFHSPYGCSKGCADQYVLDYARSYGLSAVVLRMSCIYGPHQHGNEDQGWVAHFVRSVLAGRPITIYGDGRQVRDVLYVDDLLEAFERVRMGAARLRGAFNVGGGPSNAVGVLELIRRVERITGRSATLEFADWRVGDQRYYVSDASKFAGATGWRAKVDVDAGLEALCAWIEGERTHIEPRALGARAAAGGSL